MRISRLETTRCDGGESPLWDEREQLLYFIDNMRQKVFRFDPSTGQTRRWELPSIVTALALRESGGAVVALRTGIHAFDFETGALTCLSAVEQPPPFIFNDGKVDARGRFLVGTCTTNFADPQPEGGVCSLDPDHAFRRLGGDIHFSNGPCWSPDFGTFYFSDSWTRTTYAYDYDLAAGRLGDRRVFADLRPLGGVPDGTTVDADGLVWMAVPHAGKIAVFRPDGRLERTVETPAPLPTSVMFGGPNLDVLYVTTIIEDQTRLAQGEAPQPANEAAGYVYAIEGLGARGRIEPRYAG
jgi:sugar lactone lactonase YvrE